MYCAHTHHRRNASTYSAAVILPNSFRFRAIPHSEKNQKDCEIGGRSACQIQRQHIKGLSIHIISRLMYNISYPTLLGQGHFRTSWGHFRTSGLGWWTLQDLMGTLQDLRTRMV